MVTLQQQAKALGDPTRHAVFELVAASSEPLGVSDLVEHFDVHPNAIRQHLAQLVEAELVVEATAAPSGRGRPRLVYELNPAAAGQWGTDGPYEALSEILAEIITTGSDPIDVGRAAAEKLRVPSPSGDLVADVAAAMARQGFDPDVRDIGDGVEIVLRRCPFAATADRAPDTVCAVHLGIAEGLVEGTGAAVTELVAKDPRSAGCRLRIELEPATDRSREPATLSMRRASRPS